jgi:hypothetical protein
MFSTLNFSAANKVCTMGNSDSIMCFCGEGGVTVRKMNLNVKEFGRKGSYIIRLRLCDIGDGKGINER